MNKFLDFIGGSITFITLFFVFTNSILILGKSDNNVGVLLFTIIWSSISSFWITKKIGKIK